MIGRTSLDVARRGFWSVSVPQFSGSGGAYVTKYRIAKPGREGTAWDDFLLALPEKDQLAKCSKELPLFVRYLRVLTEKEGRQADLHAFVERAKDGLEVESDVFITTEELLAIMWKNGYSEQERNAIQFTFPSDYKFHYPELAVMFDLAEEDTYKFCMRTRMEKSHIGELDANKITRKGLLRDHWILFGVGAFIMKTFPFYNYYFILKGFGTGLWFVSGYMLTSRFFLRAAARNDYMSQQKTAQEVMDGESKIMTAMKRFARDAESVDFLRSFKGDLQTKLTSYRKAIIEQHKQELAQRASKQLQNIAVFENQMNHQLQEMLVRETASAFKASASKPTTQKAFMDSALVALSGGKMENDPVTEQFNAAMQELQHVDLMTAPANPEGTIVERVAYAQQKKEKEFRNSFMVSQVEAHEVRSLAQEAKTADGYDFSKLSEQQATRLEQLFAIVNNKVGFYVPTESVTPVEGNGAAEEYVRAVNEEINATNAAVRDERLKAFVAAF